MTGARPLQVAVLVSGGGTNLQALIDEEARMTTAYKQAACSQTDAGHPSAGSGASPCPYHIALVVSSSKDAYALERAKAANIPAVVASPYAVMGAETAKTATREQKNVAVSDRVLALCKEAGIEAIVLAGFLTVLTGEIVTAYSSRIINLHPALLPKFGGVGMWGHHVHEAVLAAGETESGCTIHLVDAGCDTGKILIQKKVPVLPGDTPETLYARIAPEEHIAMVEGVKLLASMLRA